MSKKVYKRVSFIVPKLDVIGEGKISKKVYRKLIKYGNLLTVYRINGVKYYVNNEVSNSSDYLQIYQGVISVGPVNLGPSGYLQTNYLHEGDRVDVEIPFETGITVEEKVASSFEGLSGGDVGFKLWENGSIIATVTPESDFTRTFIVGIRDGSDEGTLMNLFNNGNVIAELLSGLFYISSIEGMLFIDGNGVMELVMINDFEGDITLSGGAYRGYLVELVVE